PFFFHRNIVSQRAPNDTPIPELKLGAHNPLLARRIFHCLRNEEWAEAIQVAANGYQQQALKVITPVPPIGISAQRLAIALAFPVSMRMLLRLLEQWIEPPKAETRMNVLKKTASRG